MIAVLSNEVGWIWPILFVKSVFKSSALFKQTRWASDSGLNNEAKYVRRLSLAAAFYPVIGEKMGKEKAFEIMRKILVPIGCSTVNKRFKSFNILHLTGMDRLMAFNNSMQQNDEARFNIREYRIKNDSICHYVIKRCIVYDFFSETGSPELTKLICEVDKEFFPVAFPDFIFDRNGSWENTIAYGKNECDFVLRKK